MGAARGGTVESNAVAASDSRRMVEFDLMRGVAIVFVVYLHAWFSPWAVTPYRYKLAVQIVHLFAHSAVPAFLFISGYLISRDRSASFAQFLRRKVWRIGLPMVVWMAAAFAYRAWYLGQGLGWPIWKSLLLFDISGQFYYLFVLVVFYVALFPVRHWPAAWLAKLAAAAFVVNLVAIAYYDANNPVGDWATLAYRNPAIWVFYPLLGLWLGRRSEDLRVSGGWLAAGLAAMAALFAVYLVRGEKFGDYPVSYFGVTVFLFSACAVPVYAGLARRVAESRWLWPTAAPIGDLGRYAFAIYLVHMPFFVGYVTTELVSDSAVKDDYWRLMNGIFVVGFVSALAFVLVVGRIAPRAGALLLGIEPAPGKKDARRTREAPPGPPPEAYPGVRRAP
ncbi:MAG: acyltransferase [Chloroflexi bacterium]|nr:acyltransferase [Chloroflexota bacterium]